MLLITFGTAETKPMLSVSEILKIMETTYKNPFHKPEYMGSKPEYTVIEPPVYEDKKHNCKVFHRIKSKTKDANIFDIVNNEGLLIGQVCSLEFAIKRLNPKCIYCINRTKKYCKALKRELSDLNSCCELFLV